MTNKEAIEWVENRMGIGRYHPSVHNPFVYDECCKAGDMAIDAIKKQIPKAVEADEWPNRDRELIKRYWCPACEHEVDKDRDNWCSQCGQHLLWEEEDAK